MSDKHVKMGKDNETNASGNNDLFSQINFYQAEQFSPYLN